MSSSRDPGILRIGVIAAICVVIVDQVIKQIVLDAFGTGTVGQAAPGVTVTGFFNLVLVWNKGVSFGMLATDSPVMPWLFSGLAILVSLGFGYWLLRAENRWVAFGIGLTIGGALGNVIDRLRFGAVVDFVDLHAFGRHWPAFNVADAAITIGIFSLLVASLLDRPQPIKLDES